MTEGFNIHEDEEVEQKAQEQQEEKAKQLEDTSETIGLDDGLNVFHIVPALGETFTHVPYKTIHFRPFHVCGRNDPVPDSEAKNGYKSDNNFGNCARCQKAWDVYEESGQPPDGTPEKSKFLNDMPNDRAVFQAVDFSPFFEWASEKEHFATVNEELVDKFLDDFLECVLEDADPPESMPDEMERAAKLSPGIVNVSIRSVGKKIRDTWEKKKIETEKDPFAHPDQTLMQIKRTKTGETFPAGDTEVHQRDYDVSFTADAKVKEWTEEFPKDEYMKKLVDVAVDIENQEPEEDTLEARAYAMEKFDDPTMLEYLEEQGHSFQPDIDFDPDSLDEDATSEPTEDEEEFDPDDFDEGEFAENNNMLGAGDDIDEDELEEEL